MERGMQSEPGDDGTNIFFFCVIKRQFSFKIILFNHTLQSHLLIFLLTRAMCC